MVISWGNPPDSNLVKKEIKNLQIWCGIFEREITQIGKIYPGKTYWSNLPNHIFPEDFYTWTTSIDFENMYDIKILCIHSI